MRLPPLQSFFEFLTTSLGTLKINTAITVGTIKELEALGRNAHPHEFVKRLLLCQANTPDGQKLQFSDIEKITHEELEEFSNVFVANNPRVFNKQERIVSDEEGKRVIRTNYSDELKWEKSENESASHYLMRVLEAWILDHKTTIANTFKKMMKASELPVGILSNNSLDKLLGAQRSSDKLGSALKAAMGIEINSASAAAEILKGLGTSTPSRIIPPTIDPLLLRQDPSPQVFNRLDDIKEVLSSIHAISIEAAVTVKQVSDSASSFIIDFGLTAGEANKASSRALKLGVAAIVLSVCLGIGDVGYAIYANKKSDARTDTAINLINTSIENVASANRDLAQKLAEERRINDDDLLKSIDNLSLSIESLENTLGHPSP